VPVLVWLRALHRRDRRAYAACIARIQRWPRWGTHSAAPKPLTYRVPGFVMHCSELHVDLGCLKTPFKGRF